MIEFDDVDDRLQAMGQTRAWLATITGRSAESIRSALAPNASPSKRSKHLQRAISDAIEGEEARRAKVPPGYSAIFWDDGELDRADRASRVARAPSLAEFCHDVIQAEASRLLDGEAVAAASEAVRETLIEKDNGNTGTS